MDGFGTDTTNASVMGDNAPKECLCPEFKREAVDLCRQSGMGAAQVALGIGPNRLTRWWREFEESGRSTYGGRGSARDEEIARLKREISAAQGAGFLTRRRHILRHGIEVRYRAIDAGREQDPVRLICCCAQGPTPMGHGHHANPDGRGLAVSVHGHRSVQKRSVRRADEQLAAAPARSRCCHCRPWSAR